MIERQANRKDMASVNTRYGFVKVCVISFDTFARQDQETALSAMRNLDGFEIAGRKLRVDNACTEKSRMEMQNLLQVSRSGFFMDYESTSCPGACS